MNGSLIFIAYLRVTIIESVLNDYDKHNGTIHNYMCKVMSILCYADIFRQLGIRVIEITLETQLGF